MEESLKPSPAETQHTFRLVLTSLLGVFFFVLCLYLALHFGTKPQSSTSHTLEQDQMVLTETEPFYSPPLSKEALSQVSSTAMPSLHELIEGNMLPIEPATHKPEARYQAHKKISLAPLGTGPKIAIVIDDMGVNVSESQKVIDRLPKQITLAFLPYGSASLKQAQSAYDMGHEIMVHIPMEARPNSEGYAPNPGENALYTHLEADELYKRTRLNLEPFLSLAVGANNHMGSKMTANAQAMRPALRAIADKQLFFLDSLTTAQSAVKEAAQDLPLPLLTRDVFLDHYQDADKIRDALNSTLKHAQKTGSAIAIGHPYPETTQEIEAWLETLPSNVQIVPITSLLK